MDRGAWLAMVCGVPRVGHDLATDTNQNESTQLEIRMDQSRASQPRHCGHWGLGSPHFGGQPVQSGAVQSRVPTSLMVAAPSQR